MYWYDVVSPGMDNPYKAAALAFFRAPFSASKLNPLIFQLLEMEQILTTVLP